MSINFKDLSPQALKAAMTGNTLSWGCWGSSAKHTRYKEIISPKSRRRCYCGCKLRATHRGAANGITLISGCELSIARWVKIAH